ncbi:hypothetical protein Aduo_014930 [Ancylostoma duodenale]
MNISLLSAYEFPEQLNVMITSSNKYGDEIYCQYTVHCLRREGAKFISLSNTATGAYEYPVPSTDRTQAEPVHFFSVCLAPIYGTEPKWLLLAELLEHYKLQGATYFYVYSKHIDQYSRILLDDYIRTGEAENIILHDRFQRSDDQWQPVELQECPHASTRSFPLGSILKARGHSHWVAFIDLDERLTPTEFSGTLSDYLRNVTDGKIGGLQFRQRWILKNETLPDRYTDSKQVAEWMPTWRYHNTSNVGPPGHTAKCIVDPKKALIMNVHYVDKFFDGYWMYQMKPEEGVVRHYRDVNSGKWGKIWLPEVEGTGNFSMTNYPKKWMHRLRRNVQKRVHYVYGGNQWKSIMMLCLFSLYTRSL